jgi:hypothetical protein
MNQTTNQIWCNTYAILPKCLRNSRSSKNADEILTVFLNSIILAGQLGIDIESKINDYLIQLEREALVAM